MKYKIIFIFFLFPLVSKGQYQVFDANSANAVLQANAEYIRAYGQMAQRAMQIRQTVQPYREQQYQYYKEGKYEEVIDLCYNVFRQYVYYKFDNNAIVDMEILAGDCAMKLGAYETAITWYQTAKQVDESNMNSKLFQVFNVLLNEARTSYANGNYSNLWNNVTTALKTGWENGECYFYYGVCYENANNLNDAKKMYKLAKKKKYSPAIEALKKLKKKKS